VVVEIFAELMNEYDDAMQNEATIMMKMNPGGLAKNMDVILARGICKQRLSVCNRTMNSHVKLITQSNGVSSPLAI
jgi:hypothetical protein